MKIRPQRSLSASFLLTLIVLCLIGLFFLFEASVSESFNRYGNQYYYFYRQLQWLVVGAACFVCGWIIPIKIWRQFSPIIFLLATLFLFVTLIPGLGIEINGARRWFEIGGISMQPVEFFKVALILYFSNWLSKHQRLLPLIASLLIPSIALMLQPDFGSLLVVIFIGISIYFIAGGSLKQLIPFVTGCLIILSLAVVLSPYRLRRVRSYLDPDHDPLGASFQIRQITLALGSGGFFGKGLGNSQQRFSFIPEASSDSIFAIIAEEVGLIGSLIILFLFIYYIYLTRRISLNQNCTGFEQLIVSGLWIWVAGQTLLNLAAVVALVPLTGLTLPFFSYGGSSLISLLFMNGIGYKIASINNNYNEISASKKKQ